MNRGIFSHIDWYLLMPVLILVGMGLATLLSINPGFFQNQLFFAVFSLFVFVFLTNVNYKILQVYALPLYILSLLLLIIVLFLGIESRGAVRWIDIFGIRIQFSEILKPFLVLAFASLLSEQEKSIKNFIISGAFVLPIALLITLQPDLGNGLIYLGVALLTLLVVGYPISGFGIMIVAAAGLFPLLWRFLHDYQRQRVMTFIHPSNDPLGTSYNAIQSVIAVGSGMIFGKGLGQGTQSGLRFLPERHTDFIFATLSESFGLLGGIIVLLCFGVLLYRIFVIYTQTHDNFLQILCICSFFLLLVQFFVNIGMNIGIVPIVGVTLPFVSYGGSSILSNFILLGLLSSISKSLHDRSGTLEIR